MKRQPTGFVARCQCGAIVGALDYDRTDRKEAGVIMGKWLADGCTVEPRFGESWSERLESCIGAVDYLNNKCHGPRAVFGKAPDKAA